MSNLKYWEDKIKQKRKNTDFRKFINEIASWYPILFYKTDNFISKYHDIKKIGGLLDINEFESYRQTLTDFGEKYDLNNTLFVNFSILLGKLKLPCILHFGDNENCNYSDIVVNSKNSYLSNTVVTNCENVIYSFNVKDNTKNTLNSFMIWNNSDNVYFSSGIINGYKIFYSRYINNCDNIWFSSSLIGCSECIFCYDLENKKYCINNIEINKEDYLKVKENILKDKNKFSFYYNNINKKGKNLLSKNSTGNFLIESENVENGFFSYNIHGGKNLISVGTPNGNTNMYDVFTGGSPYGSDYYGAIGGGMSNNLYSTIHIFNSSYIYYSYFLENCSFCLGCIGLKNKSYCILNKQYTKEEWELLADKIFSQMESEGTLGEFFPGELNPFYFNDTMAYLIDDSFTKQEVEKQGYMWRDAEIKVDIPEGVEVIFPHPQPLPSKEGRSPKSIQDYQGYDSNGNWQINPEILKKVIQDEKGNIYRIVQMEYDFLMKHGLPLPEIHWLDRIKMGFKFK